MGTKEDKTCPECGSSKVKFSKNGFPIFDMYGESWYCTNCRLVWSKVNSNGI